jgi:hypothetical protein
MHSICGAFFFWQSNGKAEKFPFTFWRLKVLRELEILVPGEAQLVLRPASMSETSWPSLMR